jgi:hypothetical protein
MRGVDEWRAPGSDTGLLKLVPFRHLSTALVGGTLPLVESALVSPRADSPGGRRFHREFGE